MDENKDSIIKQSFDEVLSTPFIILSGICGIVIACGEVESIQGIGSIIMLLLNIALYTAGIYFVLYIWYVVAIAVVCGGMHIENPKVYKPIISISSIIIALLVYLAYFKV